MKSKYFQLVVATVTLLFLGIAYAWSLFVSPIHQEYPMWSETSLSIVFTLCMVCFCSASMLSGKIARKIGKRRLLLICAIFYLGGMLGAGSVQEVWQLYIFYGFFCGVATGLAYNCLISTVISCFTEQSGMASGILMMGFGTGGLLLGAVVSALHEEIGWRKTFWCMAIIYFVLVFGQAMILREPEQGKQQKEDILVQGKCGNLPLIKALYTKPIWFYYVWGCMLATIGMGVIGHVAQTALEVENKTFIAVAATGMLSASNGVSRVIFGIIYDNWGRKAAMRLINGSVLLSIILFIMALLTSTSVWALAGALCMGIAYGGSVSCNSAYTREYYGTKYFAENFGFISSDGLISAFLGPTIMSVLTKMTGHYLYAYVVMLPFWITMCIMEFIISENEMK